MRTSPGGERVQHGNPGSLPLCAALFPLFLLLVMSCVVDYPLVPLPEGSGGPESPSEAGLGDGGPRGPTTTDRDRRPAGGPPRGDGGTLGPVDGSPGRCECFWYPVNRDPYLCFVEFCSLECETPGPTGNEWCVYTGSDPAPF